MDVSIDVIEKHFNFLTNTKSRYILCRGSTRSGKTIAIIQFILLQLIKHDNLHIVIGVETLRNAKGSIISDIEKLILNFGLYNDFNINKSEYTYEYKPTKSKIRIAPCDKDSKWYGLEADIFWFNEATNIDYSFFEQAEMRLPDRKDFDCKIILDFNPTNPYSWVRDLENDKEKDVETLVSTYDDNPFLGEKQVKLIESFKKQNKNKWLIFGQGEYGEVRGAIYDNWEVVDKFPENVDKVWYGLDFGFTNDETALVKVCLNNGEVYVEEMIYEVGLTNQDIIQKMKDMKINKEIIADSAEPKSIEEIRRAAFNIRGVKKAGNSIVTGIQLLQNYKINIVKGSKNIKNEIINYTWKEDKRNGKFYNTPIDGWDHALTALRYVAMEKFNKQSGVKIVRLR